MITNEELIREVYIDPKAMPRERELARRLATQEDNFRFRGNIPRLEEFDDPDNP